MSIKSNYFKMNSEDFKSYLDNLKPSLNTLNFLDGKFFYTHSIECNNLVLQIEKKV